MSNKKSDNFFLKCLLKKCQKIKNLLINLAVASVEEGKALRLRGEDIEVTLFRGRLPQEVLHLRGEDPRSATEGRSASGLVWPKLGHGNSSMLLGAILHLLLWENRAARRKGFNLGRYCPG